MIKNIDLQIKAELEKADLYKGGDLSYMKYNTPISGRGIGCKVILFVFDSNKKPIAIIKTVRNIRDINRISDGYKNISLLNKLVQGSEFESMYPKAIGMHEDNLIKYTIETVCGGVKVSREADLKKAIDKYFSFSKYISSGLNEQILDKTYGEKLVSVLSGDNGDIEILKKYNEDLWSDIKVDIKSIYQHGDFTNDNILIDNEKIKIVDCDTFGDIAIPGFDIYHITVRNKMKDSYELLSRYFVNVGIDYKIDKKLIFVYFLHELCIKKDYILLNRKAEDLIKEFDNIIELYYSQII